MQKERLGRLAGAALMAAMSAWAGAAQAQHWDDRRPPPQPHPEYRPQPGHHGDAGQAWRNGRWEERRGDRPGWYWIVDGIGYYYSTPVYPQSRGYPSTYSTYQQPVYAQPTYSQPTYSQPTYSQPSTVIVEQPPQQTAQPAVPPSVAGSATNWYYCPTINTYYPNAVVCPNGQRATAVGAR